MYRAGRRKWGQRVVAMLAAVVLVGIVTLFLVPLAATSGWKIINLSPLDLPDKGNPKLDSQLNQLVNAEMRGEAASFAQQINIELLNG